MLEDDKHLAKKKKKKEQDVENSEFRVQVEWTSCMKKVTFKQ